MKGLNRVFIIGYIGRDPESKTTASGVTVVTLSVATPASRKVDGEWVDTPDWHRLTLWDRHGDYVARYARKGDTIAVEAAIKPSKWTDREGKVRYETNIVVEQVLWLAPKQVREHANPPPPRGYEGGARIPDSDLPPPPDDSDFCARGEDE